MTGKPKGSFLGRGPEGRIWFGQPVTPRHGGPLSRNRHTVAGCQKGCKKLVEQSGLCGRQAIPAFRATEASESYFFGGYYGTHYRVRLYPPFWGIVFYIRNIILLGSTTKKNATQVSLHSQRAKSVLLARTSSLHPQILSGPLSR